MLPLCLLSLNSGVVTEPVRDQPALLLGPLQNVPSSPSPDQVSVSQGWYRATVLSIPSRVCPRLASLLALWKLKVLASEP